MPLPPPPPTLSSVLPAAFMVYTDIQKLQGLDVPIDYGSGIEYANGISSLYAAATAGSSFGLQIGLWLGGSEGCRQLVHTTVLDDNLQRLFHYMMHHHNGSAGAGASFETFFVRIGYEFDNPQFGYSSDPALYRRAFIKIVQEWRRFRLLNNANNKNNINKNRVNFVWHSWAAGVPENTTLMDYYPGNDYVDWIGISLFRQFYNKQQPENNDDSAFFTGGNRQTIQEVLDFAHQHAPEAPIMIAESTPFFGFHDDHQRLMDPWNDWFVPVLDLIEQQQQQHVPSNPIAMWSYINCDWESQPLWHKVGFGDTRISQNQTIQKLWFQHVQNNPRFVKQSDIIAVGGGGDLCSPGAMGTTSTKQQRHDLRSEALASLRVLENHNDYDDYYYHSFNKNGGSSGSDNNNDDAPAANGIFAQAFFHPWAFVRRHRHAYWWALLPIVILLVLCCCKKAFRGSISSAAHRAVVYVPEIAAKMRRRLSGIPEEAASDLESDSDDDDDDDDQWGEAQEEDNDDDDLFFDAEQQKWPYHPSPQQQKNYGSIPTMMEQLRQPPAAAAENTTTTTSTTSTTTTTTTTTPSSSASSAGSWCRDEEGMTGMEQRFSTKHGIWLE